MTTPPFVYFNSSNPRKHEDIARMFADSPRPPRSLYEAVPEILTADLEQIVRAKTIAAYKRCFVPLFVEHGGIYVEALGDLPGPLVKIFCENLSLDGFCRLVPPGSRRAAFRNIVGYCDGFRLRLFEGTISGSISTEPRGSGGIHWDPVFIPDESSQTMGEMDPARRLTVLGDTGAVAKLRHSLGI